MLHLEIFFIVAGACAAVIGLLHRSSMANLLLDRVDKPNAMHNLPVPRIGGIVIVLVVTASLFVYFHARPIDAMLRGLLLTGFGLAVVSLIDDRRNLSVSLRLATHVLAAIFVAVMPAWQGMSMVNLLIATILVLITVWMTNLYNFMDGANGLAGFMGVIGFGSFAMATQFAQSSANTSALAFICTAISGACLGFLFFNFPKARVFMGDAGSIPLGFLAAALGLVGSLENIWPWWFPALVFSPFIVDASVTLAKRLIRRERVWETHRQHVYHRLILQSGWSHAQTASAYALLMLLCGGHGLLALSAIHDTLAVQTGKNLPVYATPLFIMGVWVLTYALLLACLEWRFSMRIKK